MSVPPDASFRSQHTSVIDSDAEAHFVMGEMLADDKLADAVYQIRRICRVCVAVGAVEQHHHPVANDSSNLSVEDIRASRHRAHKSGIELGDRRGRIAQA